MNEPRQVAAGRWWLWLSACALGLLLVGEAIFTNFSTASIYDDQGYVMMTLRSYRRGFPLFDAVYSQYGPAYYALRDWAYGSLAVTHDLTGLVSILHVLGCIAALAAVAWRATRNIWLAALAAALVGSRLRHLSGEQGHPQEFIALLAALLVLVAFASRGRWRSAVVAGALAALVMLTKVNFGVFVLLPLLLMYVGDLPDVRWRRLLGWPLKAAVVILPVALMRARLGQEWAFSLAFVLTAALIPLLPGFGKTRRDPGWAPLTGFVAGFGTTFVALLLHQFSRGTSPRGMWHGLVAQHLHFADAYAAPFLIGTPHCIVAAGALAAWLHYRIRPWSLPMLAAVCGAFGLLLAAVMMPYLGNRAVVYLAPFLWLVPELWNRCAAMPGSGGSLLPEQSRFHGFLFLMTVTVCLGSYPVMGSQLSSATHAFAVVAVLALHGALMALSHEDRFAFAVKMRGATAGVGVLLALGIWKAALVGTLYRDYRAADPAGLPGMALYRLPRRWVEAQHWLVRHLQRFDTFISMPGLNSVYFWTGQTPPVTKNAGAWMRLFDDATQEEIIAKLRAVPKLGGVRYLDGVRYWTPLADIEGRPLVDFINHEMQPIAEKDGFEILERKPD